MAKCWVFQDSRLNIFLFSKKKFAIAYILKHYISHWDPFDPQIIAEYGDIRDPNNVTLAKILEVCGASLEKIKIDDR